MGSYVSTDNSTGSAAEADLLPTAKVITVSGSLREYPSHLTAADVLAGDTASCFLCNSDGLFCDDYIPPLDPEEPLRPGQLYFVLPTAKLRYPLSGSDMKELVGKASSALALASEKGGWRRKKKDKKVRTTPTSEVDGGQHGGGGGDREANHPGRRSVTSHSVMKRSGSVRKRVSFRCRFPSGARLSIILEVAEPCDPETEAN